MEIPCDACGKKEAVYRVQQVNGHETDRIYCNDCWTKMFIAFQQSGNATQMLLAQLMKAAPRVTDRDSKSIREHFLDSISAKCLMLSSPELTDKLLEIAGVMITCLRREGTIFTCGTGICAAEADHIARELMGRCKLDERRTLPAISLSAAPNLIDDFSYENVFLRQVEGLVTEHDVLIGLCVDGDSLPVLRALRAATEQGAFTIGITGGEGGALLDSTRLCLLIPGANRHLIEECQQIAVHVLCRLVENALCEDGNAGDHALV